MARPKLCVALLQLLSLAALAATSQPSDARAPGRFGHELLKHQREIERRLRQHGGQLKQKLEEVLQGLDAARTFALRAMPTGAQDGEAHEWTPEDGNFSRVLPASDLRNTSRSVTIITTASLPWMTGTAVNPLLRAAYLTRGRAEGKVTLVVPFLRDEAQQRRVFGNRTFATEAEQERHIRSWLAAAGLGEEAGLLRIRFYDGTYIPAYGSIFPSCDLVALLDDDDGDVCVLEEPEHLTWHHHGTTWSSRFRYVIGVVHTNYLHYSREANALSGALQEFTLRLLNKWVCRAYCDRIIKLSGTLQEYAVEKEVVCNVHGVRPQFTDIGDNMRHFPSFKRDAYFIGKSVWAKGHDKLMAMLDGARAGDLLGEAFCVDMYGDGPDQEAIVAKAKKVGAPLRFLGAIDHARLADYRVMVNPSTSEVLATTVAEAIAMGKFVVCARHPSNAFFYDFDNCLTYTSKQEFLAALQWALTHEPKALTAAQRRKLTWQAATERFMDAASITYNDARRHHRDLDKQLSQLHHSVASSPAGEMVRAACGLSAVTLFAQFKRQQQRAAQAP